MPVTAYPSVGVLGFSTSLWICLPLALYCIHSVEAYYNSYILLGGGGFVLSKRGVRKKGGSREPPEPPLATGLVVGIEHCCPGTYTLVVGIEHCSCPGAYTLYYQ